jgi:hypothetical protein
LAWVGLTEIRREVDLQVMFGGGRARLEHVGRGWLVLAIVKGGKWIVLVGCVLLGVEFHQVFLSAGFGVFWQDFARRSYLFKVSRVAFPDVMHRFRYSL